jgi:hypothetical protein
MENLMPEPLKTIEPQLHMVSPYQGLTPSGHNAPVFGWFVRNDLFHAEVSALRPQLVIELGTWLGGSALCFAQALRDLEIDGEVVCVDTWLGSEEFWTPGVTHPDGYDRYAALELRNGYPSVYFRFLQNVVDAELSDVITPFPTTGDIAARWFRQHGVQADLIYIDASHDEDSVGRDIGHYMPLLTPAGTLMGDDHSASWPGVIAAVAAFAAARDVRIVLSGEKWLWRRRNELPLALARDAVRDTRDSAGLPFAPLGSMEGYVEQCIAHADGTLVEILGWARRRSDGRPVDGILAVTAHTRYVIEPGWKREDVADHNDQWLGFAATLPVDPVHGLRLFLISNGMLHPLQWERASPAVPAFTLERGDAGMRVYRPDGREIPIASDDRPQPWVAHVDTHIPESVAVGLAVPREAAIEAVAFLDGARAIAFETVVPANLVLMTYARDLKPKPLYLLTLYADGACTLSLYRHVQLLLMVDQKDRDIL